MISNPQLELAYQFAEYTNKNIFLTGKAGTGKTTFLHHLRYNTFKRCIVVAPTGVAAINAKGVTIHSFFQLPFGPHIPSETLANNNFQSGYIRMSKSKIDIIKSLDLLIIDEISMVRADQLDAIDESLRRYRKNSNPFGGVQLLMIGDIQQLSPVVKDEDWHVLKNHYDTAFFYGSTALKKTDYVSIELKHIFRQNDSQFINLLNSIRENKLTDDVLKQLNARYIPNFSYTDADEYITLTTHVAKAKTINQQKLDGIVSKSHHYKAVVQGEYPDYSYPTEYNLEIKTGAQVMFVKNDASADKRFYNGKIGVVNKIDTVNDCIYVKCADSSNLIVVEKLKWENTKYAIDDNTKEIAEEVIGSFTQYPLKLAWAITIHKSQGLTFDKAIIDAQSSFAHGQVYVALSRCRTLEGMVLSSPLHVSSVKTDEQVLSFSKAIEDNPLDKNQLQQATVEFYETLIFELFDFSDIRRKIFSCVKMAENHAMSLVKDFTSLFGAMNVEVKSQMIDTSLKFHQQLKSIIDQSANVETDSFLQDRIKKGSAFYKELMVRVVLDKLKTVSTSSDNKKAKKEMAQALENLIAAAQIKIACLDASVNGFELKAYIKARAVASLQPAENSAKSTTSSEAKTEGLEHPELFEILRQWRNYLAQTANKSAFHVFSQKTIIDISNSLPSSLTELSAVKGVGRKKVLEYGSQILELIGAYCAKKSIAYTANQEVPLVKEKAPKIDTKQVSFDMFKAGKSIADIATERSFSATTIESHLAHYIEMGQLEVSKFLNHTQLKEILSVVEELELTQLTPLKEALDHKYDYGMLRMAVAFYHFSQAKEV